jgi:DNA recombination-dependent growth factor C
MITVSKLGERWIATCDSLDCSSSGFSKEAAIENLKTSANSTISLRQARELKVAPLPESMQKQSIREVMENL